MNEDAGICIAAALGLEPLLLEVPALPGLSFGREIFTAAAHNTTASLREWSPEEFKAKFYTERWQKQAITAHHPNRFADFWLPATVHSNWILVGDKPGAVVAVVRGKETVPPSRFKVLSLIEIPRIDPENRPFKDLSIPGGGKTTLERETPLGGAILGGLRDERDAPKTRERDAPKTREGKTGGKDRPNPKEAFKTADIAPIEGDIIEKTALSYVKWALDCVNRKNYSDAKEHLKTAIRKAEAQKRG